jgi:hypothetical protein
MTARIGAAPPSTGAGQNFTIKFWGHRACRSEKGNRA